MAGFLPSFVRCLWSRLADARIPQVGSGSRHSLQARKRLEFSVEADFQPPFHYGRRQQATLRDLTLRKINPQSYAGNAYRLRRWRDFLN